MLIEVYNSIDLLITSQMIGLGLPNENEWSTALVIICWQLSTVIIVILLVFWQSKQFFIVSSFSLQSTAQIICFI